MCMSMCKFHSIDYFYEQHDVVSQSTYFLKLSQLVHDVKQFNSDMQSIEWPSHVRKYLVRAKNFFQQKYAEIDEYLVVAEQAALRAQMFYENLLKTNPDLEAAIESWNKFNSFIL